MDRRNQYFQLMYETGIVAVIRAESSLQLMDIIGALRDGGVRAIEITMTTPNAVDAIKEARERFKDQIIGVGSVLDSETARAALLAGAEFVVSPTFNRDIVSMCKRYSKLVIPGAFTPTEILTAWEAGADVVKVFPATKLGPEFFKDVLGPLPQVKLTPTGGVDLDTTPKFIKNGAVFVGVGGKLVSKDAVNEGNWSKISETAEKFIAAVKLGRS
jgi:2-dehydro-3-deoxyphosphogluconate aldolase/(4S)-4-hydroxy-2-oxoglutarate aldolase